MFIEQILYIRCMNIENPKLQRIIKHDVLATGSVHNVYLNSSCFEFRSFTQCHESITGLVVTHSFLSVLVPGPRDIVPSWLLIILLIVPS